MGRAIDLSREQVSRLEGGVNAPQPRTVERVAEVFGLPVEQLKAPLMAAARLEDFMAAAKLHFESRSSTSNAKGLDRFGQIVVWFRSMTPSDQSLTLAALQRIHDDSIKSPIAASKPK